MEQFNLHHARLTDWLEIHRPQLDKPLHLSTLDADVELFKDSLNIGISLQSDLTTLEEHLTDIEYLTTGFHINDEENIQLFKQRLTVLSAEYWTFLKSCQQICEHCDRSKILSDEIDRLDDAILTSITDFDQQLAMTEVNSQVCPSCARTTAMFLSLLL